MTCQVSHVLPLVKLRLIFLGGSLVGVVSPRRLVTAGVSIMLPSALQERRLVAKTSDTHVHVAGEGERPVCEGVGRGGGGGGGGLRKYAIMNMNFVLLRREGVCHTTHIMCCNILSILVTPLQGQAN